MSKSLLNEVKAFIFFSLSIIFFLSLLSYTPQDLRFLSLNYNQPPQNLISYFGAYLGFVISFIFGYVGFLIPLILFVKGLEVSFEGFSMPEGILRRKTVKFLFYFLLIWGISTLLSSIFFRSEAISFRYGGITGLLCAQFLKFYFRDTGTFIIIFTFIFLVLTSLFGLPFLTKLLPLIFEGIKKIFKKSKTEKTQPLVRKIRTKPPIEVKKIKKETEQLIPSLSSQTKIQERELRKEEIIKPLPGELPSLSILDLPPPLSQRKIKENIKENAQILKETLDDFGIGVEVVNIDRGPTVTLYELELAAGIKVQRIISLSDDIALALKAPSVRVVAPLPGRGTVGVEAPNTEKHIVYLREVMDTREFRESRSLLALALGKDTSGKPVVADLCSMPHLLVAGTTGSGKTVCINSIISSILFKAPHNKVRLILIDPKMVELVPYDGIPHLLCPVIQEVGKASKVLSWLVEEMERRYRIFAEEGARNISMFNEKEFRMPYIVVVVDELADFMLTARDKVESAILRLAQLARGVGIHMALATQRPSVDVITGVIKANFPARISFKVASKVDSRTVLDFTGADKLLGKGDMLFLRPDLGRPIRSQGSFISDGEISRIVKFLKNQAPCNYDQDLMKYLESPKLKTERDPLFDEAVQIILESGQASVSILQRRLHLGYTRAARLIDSMEEEGIVGPFEGSRPRKILIDKSTWESIRGDGE